MNKFMGMDKRMKRAWTDGFSQMPPLFWLPYFAVLVIWSVAWLGFCFAGWLIGFYGCKGCLEVKHRSVDKPVYMKSYYDDWSHTFCIECNEVRKKKEQPKRPPTPPSTGERPSITKPSMTQRPSIQKQAR